MVDLMGHAFERAHRAHPSASIQELAGLSLEQDPDVVLCDVLGGREPHGLLRLCLRADGSVVLEHGTPARALSGTTARFGLLVDSERDGEADVVAGHARTIGPRGAALFELTRSPAAGCEFLADGARVDLSAAFVSAEAATLVLRAAHPQRWSVIDAAGGAWFPAFALLKWDFHGRPFLPWRRGQPGRPRRPGRGQRPTVHGVRRGRAKPRCRCRHSTTVELGAPRRIDPAASGWYGGDLHVHMNYGGDLVCSPDDAARMQLGEGLHLMNLVAATARPRASSTAKPSSAG